MTYTEQVMAEFGEETQETPAVEQEQPQEAVEAPEATEDAPAEEKPAEATETQQEEPEENPEAPEETPADTTVVEEEPKPKPKKDLSGLSKEEKAEFAFQKQLAKQKAKYESSLDEIKQQVAELKQQVKPKEEEPPKKLTRDMFDTDDEMIEALVEQKMALRQKEIDRQKEAEAQQQKAMEAAREKEQQAKDDFRANCQAAFPDEAQYAEFTGKVQKAVEAGLGDILDAMPAVRDYLFFNQNGPIVLNEMLNDRDAAARILDRTHNPIDAVVEMHDMAREIRNRANEQPEPEQEKAPVMPKLGKPGTTRGSSSRSFFDSDDDLIEWTRQHR